MCGLCGSRMFITLSCFAENRITKTNFILLFCWSYHFISKVCAIFPCELLCMLILIWHAALIISTQGCVMLILW